MQLSFYASVNVANDSLGCPAPIPYSIAYRSDNWLGGRVLCCYISLTLEVRAKDLLFSSSSCPLLGEGGRHALRNLLTMHFEVFKVFGLLMLTTLSKRKF